IPRFLPPVMQGIGVLCMTFSFVLFPVGRQSCSAKGLLMHWRTLMRSDRSSDPVFSSRVPWHIDGCFPQRDGHRDDEHASTSKRESSCQRSTASTLLRRTHPWCSASGRHSFGRGVDTCAQPLKVVRPFVHHLATLFHELGAVVG